VDDLHARRGDQPLGRRRLTRLLVRVAALVHVAPFGTEQLPHDISV